MFKLSWGQEECCLYKRSKWQVIEWLTDRTMMTAGRFAILTTNTVANICSSSRLFRCPKRGPGFRVNIIRRHWTGYFHILRFQNRPPIYRNSTRVTKNYHKVTPCCHNKLQGKYILKDFYKFVQNWVIRLFQMMRRKCTNNGSWIWIKI